MIPQNNAPQPPAPTPGRTWRLDPQRGRIGGVIDGLEAAAQAAQKILRTQRGAHLIYDETYGADLEQYVGRDAAFAAADLEREAARALAADDRVLGVRALSIEPLDSEALRANFSVRFTCGTATVAGEVTV